jgi:hypothetical protein
LANAHPAVVHAPIGAVLFLPLALGFALRSSPNRDGWLRTGHLLAILGLLGAVAAMTTGLLFARELGGIRPGAWLAHPVRPEPSFPALLRTHQLLALSGLPFGVGCLALWGAAGHWGGRMVFKEEPVEGSGY